HAARRVDPEPALRRRLRVLYGRAAERGRRVAVGGFLHASDRLRAADARDPRAPAERRALSDPALRFAGGSAEAARGVCARGRARRGRATALNRALAASLWLAAAAARGEEPTALAPGATLQRELAGGETHVFVVSLAADDYV